MPLPWTAPGYGQGIYPSQAPFFIPDKIDPRLVASIAAQREQQQQGISDAIQGAIGSIGKMMDQHRQDAIASQLLAGSAPHATYVGPGTSSDAAPTGDSPEAAARDSGDGAAPVGTPNAVLSSGERAHNLALGYPDQQLLHPAEIYHAQQQLYTQNLNDMVKQAHIARLVQLGYGQGQDHAPTGKIWSQSLGGWATPVQDAAERRRQVAEAAGGTLDAGAKAFYKDVEANTGLSKDILNKLDTTTPYSANNPATIQYVDANGKPVSYEDATKNPAKMKSTFATSPSFAGKIPLPAFNKMMASFHNLQSAQPGPATSTGGYTPRDGQQGYIDGSPVTWSGERQAWVKPRGY